jgi:hypothetical protein
MRRSIGFSALTFSQANHHILERDILCLREAIN